MAAVTYDPEADVLYVELAHVKDPGNEGEEGLAVSSKWIG